MSNGRQHDNMGGSPEPTFGTWTRCRRGRRRAARRGRDFNRVSYALCVINVLLHMLLFAMCPAPTPVLGVNKPYTLTDYSGHLAISSPENIHVSTETGHLLFRVDVVKELSFVQVQIQYLDGLQGCPANNRPRRYAC